MVDSQSEFAKLHARIHELGIDEHRQFEEIEGFYGNVKKLTEQAALLVVRRTGKNSASEEMWFPFSQLRFFNDELVASKWILKKNGLL